MSFPSVNTIRLRLILLIMLGMLLCAGAVVFNAVIDRNRKVKALQAETARAAKASAENVSRLLGNAQQLLATLAAKEAVTKMDGTAASAVFAEQLQQSKMYLNFGIAQPDGLIVGSALPRERPVYLADRSYTARVQKKHDFCIGDFLRDESTGKPTLNFGFPLPVRPGEIPPGIVYASLDLSVLNDCISTATLPVNSVILVTDRMGIYLARHPNLESWVGTKSRAWELMEIRGDERTGFIESTGADLIPRTYYNTPVPGSDNSLFVAVGISNAAILAECKAALLHKLYWIAGWGVLALVGAWYLSHLMHSFFRYIRQKGETTRKVVEEARAEQEEEPTQRLSEEKVILNAEIAAVVPEVAQESEPEQRIVAEERSPLAEPNEARQEAAPDGEPAHWILAGTMIPQIALNGFVEEPSKPAEPTRRLAPEELIATAAAENGETVVQEQSPPPAEILKKAQELLRQSTPTQRIAPEELEPIAQPSPITAPSITRSRINPTLNMNATSNPHDGTPELNQLAQSFESMSTVLREHNERLERAVREQTAAVTAVDEAWEQEIARHRQAEIALKARRIEQEQVIRQLQEALDQVKSITGLLPASSDSRRNDKGRWNQPVESHPTMHNGAQSSNGYAPESAKKPDVKIDRPPAPTRLNGFDAGPLYFADLKIEVPPKPTA